MTFTVFYGDFSSYEGDDPSMVSPRDVQAIVQPDYRVGVCVLSGWDWYYWRDDLKEWWGSDLHGLLDQLMARLPVMYICQGRHMPSDQYQKLLSEVKSQKSAILRGTSPKGR